MSRTDDLLSAGDAALRGLARGEAEVVIIDKSNSMSGHKLAEACRAAAAAVEALREYFDSFWGQALASFRAAAQDQSRKEKK